MIEQVSRNNGLKIPKKIDVIVKKPNNIEDEIATLEAIAKANNQKLKKV